MKWCIDTSRYFRQRNAETSPRGPGLDLAGAVFSLFSIHDKDRALRCSRGSYHALQVSRSDQPWRHQYVPQFIAVFYVFEYMNLSLVLSIHTLYLSAPGIFPSTARTGHSWSTKIIILLRGLPRKHLRYYVLGIICKKHQRQNKGYFFGSHSRTAQRCRQLHFR